MKDVALPGPNTGGYSQSIVSAGYNQVVLEMSVSDLLHSSVRLSFPTAGAPPSICPKYTSSVCYSWPCPCSFSSATSALQGISLLPLTVPQLLLLYDLLYNHSSLSSVFTAIYVLCLAQHRQ